MRDMYNRGGTCLATGKIGRARVLRQQLLRPGETIKPRITGTVYIESLRERRASKIHAQIFTFLTPCRWLDDTWTDGVKAGPNGSFAVATATGVPDHYGVGSEAATTMLKVFIEAPKRCYNEWMKWPEAADVTTWPQDGQPVVPLEAAFSRVRDSMDPASPDDSEVGAGAFDVRDLAQVQAMFRSAMERDVFAEGRYSDVLREAFGAEGSREVDQVPILVDDESGKVRPQEQPATDAGGLGQFMSLYDFEVGHNVGAITAPEHCVLTYFLVVRFQSITRDDGNPLAHQVRAKSYATQFGDPGLLAAQRPEQVRVDDVLSSANASVLGYLSAGWQWRFPWNHVGSRIETRASFPIYQTPVGPDDCRNASRVENAFRSSALGDYFYDLEFDEPAFMSMPSAETTNMGGMGSAGRNSKQLERMRAKVK